MKLKTEELLNLLEGGFLEDTANLFWNKEPDANRRIECACGWRGSIADCKEERYRSDPQSWNSLGGRDGWIYKCPRCHLILTSYFFAMS
jgi:hypothetical protein